MRKLLAVFIPLTLCACVDASLNRFDKPLIFAQDSNPTLTVASAGASSNSSVGLKDLPERSAAAYVEAMAGRTKTPEELRASLAESIRKDGGGAIDQSSLSRVITVGVQRDWLKPGDRYIMTAIEIRAAKDGAEVPTKPGLDDDPRKPLFTFSGFESAATEYATINIGTVTVSNENSQSAEIDPTFGSDLIGSGKFILSNKNSRSATRAIGEREQLSVTVAPEEIRILRTGAEGHDLTGLTLVKLAVRPADHMATMRLARPILVKDGVILEPDDAKIEFANGVIGPERDYWVCARMSYQERRVREGAEHLDEGRQTAIYAYGHTPWTAHRLISQSETLVPLWIVNTPHGGVSLDTGLGDPTLYFSDYGAAENFATWLRLKKKGSIGGRTLNEGGPGRPLQSFNDLQATLVSANPTDTPVGKPTCPPGGPDAPPATVLKPVNGDPAS